MILSLDSSALIDVVNGHPTGREFYDRAIYHQVPTKICVFAAHEVLYGAFISARPAYHESHARQLFADSELVDWSMEDAETAARLRADLSARGQTIGSVDSVIAGQALARDWTVVTSNVREFSRVAGLKVIDWTAAVA